MLVDIEVHVLILLELDGIKLHELVTDSLRVDKLVEVEATANQATLPAINRRECFIIISYIVFIVKNSFIILCLSTSNQTPSSPHVSP